MNEQLANFFVEFTTQGLEEVKDGLSEINDKLDGLDKGFGSAIGGADKLFGSLGALLGKLGLFGSVIAAVGAAVANAFDVGDRAIDLRNLSEATGESAEKLETMGIVLRKYGGDINTAGSLYKNLNEMLLDYSQGKLPEEHREMISRYGEYGLSIQAGMTPDEVLENFQRTFNNLRAAGKVSEINQIADAYGLDQSVMVMLMQSMDDLREEVKNAQGQLILSREETQNNAEQLRQARIELKASWDDLTADLIPLITAVVDVLNWLIDGIKDLWGWLKSVFGGGEEETEEQKKIREVREDALKASDKIKLGIYDVEDILTVKKALDEEVMDGWTDKMYGDAYKSLGMALEALQMTNTPLNTYTESSVSSDNRSVNVGSINVNGDTGSVKGIRSAIGSVVRDEMGSLINSGNNARGQK